MRIGVGKNYQPEGKSYRWHGSRRENFISLASLAGACRPHAHRPEPVHTDRE